ncbi:unnamed protein product, partial [Nesidiocoris tenuis]
PFNRSHAPAGTSREGSSKLFWHPVARKQCHIYENFIGWRQLRLPTCEPLGRPSRRKFIDIWI